MEQVREKLGEEIFGLSARERAGIKVQADPGASGVLIDVEISLGVRSQRPQQFEPCQGGAVELDNSIGTRRSQSRKGRAEVRKQAGRSAAIGRRKHTDPPVSRRMARIANGNK